MPSATFLTGMLLALVESAGYVAVGLLLLRRFVPPEARFANSLFAAWWILIGTNKALSAGASLATAGGLVGFDAYLTVLLLNVPILAVSLGCLLTYLLYLLTGSRRVVGWVAALYGFYYLLLTYNILAGRPVGVEEGPWRLVLVSEGTAPVVVRLLTLVLLGLPQIVAAAAYSRLAFHVRTPTQRWRILLVSWAIIAWTASLLLLALPGLGDSAAAQLASRAVGLAAAFASLAAYVPPAWARRRWLVEPLGDARTPIPSAAATAR